MRHCCSTIPLYHYLNGVIILGGEIEVPVNSFYETSDGKWMCFNGAYSHLRNGILNYFDAANNMDALAAAVSKVPLRNRAGFRKAGIVRRPEAHPRRMAGASSGEGRGRQARHLHQARWRCQGTHSSGSEMAATGGRTRHRHHPRACRTMADAGACGAGCRRDLDQEPAIVIFSIRPSTGRVMVRSRSSRISSPEGKEPPDRTH